jgi:hypothetical protein
MIHGCPDCAPGVPCPRCESDAGRVRAAFRAGFMAHPDAEAPEFRWRFDQPLRRSQCSSTDREQSAWEAYCQMERERLRHALRPLVGGE